MNPKTRQRDIIGSVSKWAGAIIAVGTLLGMINAVVWNIVTRPIYDHIEKISQRAYTERREMIDVFRLPQSQWAGALKELRQRWDERDAKQGDK